MTSEPRRSQTTLVIAFVSFVAAAQAQSLQPRMVAAEDARVTSALELTPFLTGLRSTDPRLVVQAVRALGRFERPELVKHILPVVTHARAEVRAEAANALGQALARIPRGADEKSPLPPETETVSRTLAARIRTDPDPYVTGVAAETVGRLPYRTANAVSEAEATLSAMLPPGASSARVRVESAPLARVVHPGAITGAVKGLETLIRVYQKLQAPSSDTLDRLRGAATLGSDPSDGDFAFIRRVSWLALTAAAGAHESLIEHGLEDPDAQVRRLAVLSLGNAKDVDAERPALIARALKDRSFIVRYDAVRVYSRTLQAQDCAPVLAAVDDANAHVALAAIDALGNGCPTAAPRLRALADALPKPNPNFEREPGTRNPEPRRPGTSRRTRSCRWLAWRVRMRRRGWRSSLSIQRGRSECTRRGRRRRSAPPRGWSAWQPMPTTTSEKPPSRDWRNSNSMARTLSTSTPSAVPITSSS